MHTPLYNIGLAVYCESVTREHNVFKPSAYELTLGIKIVVLKHFKANFYII